MSEQSTCAQIGQQVEYRDIPGFPQYRVGNNGTVWSCWRGKWKEISPSPTSVKCPHLAVKLYPGRRNALVHRLVLEAFVGPCPDGMECCHNDGNHQNNHLSNLRWDTRTANQADMIQHGTRLRGERKARAKLTPDSVRQIRKLLNEGNTMQSIAGKFGISDVTVCRIKHRQMWSHVL